MNSNENTTPTNSPSRRKFVWGFSVLTAFTAFAASRLSFLGKKDSLSGKPVTKKKTIKMLTQDGRLVEVDESVITATRKKVSTAELKNWIKK
jgi:hypothetical protein